MLEDRGDGIGGQEGIGKSEDGEDAVGRAGGQVQRGRENAGACAFRPDQRAGYMETVLRQQLVEVVAGNAPRNARVFLPDQA